MGHLRLITNNPTQGGKDGTVTPIPTTTIPINAIVNTGTANHTLVKVALRCDVGYMTTGEWEVSFVGTTAARWSVADGLDRRALVALHHGGLIPAVGVRKERQAVLAQLAL